MAALGSLYPTIVDIVKKSDPAGGIASMVELLAKKNAHLQDIAWKQGNLPTGHKFSIRTALPSPAWRKMNQGVAASKSQADTLVETCGMLEGYAKVDVALAELNGNAAAFRRDEDNAFLMSFGLTVADALLYSSVASNPEQIQGFTPRMSATAGNVAASQILKQGGGTASLQTSVWLVGWSPDTVYGIYPKNSQAGFHSEDLGKQLVKDASSNDYTAYVTHHKWDLGLAVQDWRYLARACNIEASGGSGLKADLSSGADLVMAMTDLMVALYSLDGVQPVYYCNRNVFSFFNKQLFKKGTTNLLEYIERGGAVIPHFLGMPIRIVDALKNVESVVA